MTHPSPPEATDPDLERRLRAIARRRAALVDDVDTPDPAGVRSQLDGAANPTDGGVRRRPLLLGAAAAAAVVAIVAGVLVATGGRSSDVTVTPQTPSSGIPRDGLVIGDWRDGTPGPEVMTAGYAAPGGSRSPRRSSVVLGRTGPEVLAEVLDLPLGSTLGEPDDLPIDVDGRPGIASRTVDGESVSVELRPGRQLRLLSTRVDRDALIALARSFDAESGDVIATALSAEWRQLDSHDGLLSLGAAGESTSGYDGIYQRTDITVDRAFAPGAGVRWHEIADPDLVIAQLVEMWQGEAVSVGDQEGVWIAGHGLVWSADDRRIAWTSLTGYVEFDGELPAALALAESVRAVGADEWSSVMAAATPAPRNGITLSPRTPTARLLDRGSTPVATWELVEDGDQIQIRMQGRPSGVTAIFGRATQPWVDHPVATWADSGLLVAWAAVPLDLVDVSIEVDGTAVETLTVDLDGDGVKIAFAMLDGRNSGTAPATRVTGRGPDGTPYSRAGV